MTFAVTFRELVTPRLRKRARFAGWMLALGEWEWSEAERYVVDLARKLGMMRLADHLIDELLEGVSIQILAAFDEFEPRVDAYHALADRVWRQVQRWDAALIEATACPAG